MLIRNERKKDYFQVENLTREAFWNVYRPGCVEHLVVNKLRNKDYFVKDLDYVLEENGEIIASIFYAVAKIKGDTESEVLTFGPVSVKPCRQKKGYGEKLINFTLKKAKNLGYAAVIITGNPDYYKKYGFVPCKNYDIYYEGTDKNDPAPFFMIKVLNEQKVAAIKGVYKDPDCYLVDEKEVEVFDEKFSKKEKLKTDTQIF